MRSPPFSARTAWNLAGNRYAALLERVRSSGHAATDLTESNPTRCGLCDARLLEPLADARAGRYEPSALGHPEARAAVERYYADQGVRVDPAHVLLSASTSEAYGWLFALLCDRGDEVLVPQPSYPLLADLAALADVRLVPYPMLREERFRIDLSAVSRAVSPRTRAISLVHPNNPTGTFVRRDDAAGLEQLATQHGLALVVDEVFSDYAHGTLAPDRLPTFAGPRACLTFVLSGLSKVCALPQLKLAWTTLHGPPAVVDQALSRLEVVADAYLSVGTPVQLAASRILAARGEVQARIRERVEGNLRVLDAALPADAPVRRLPTDGGWYAVLEVPRTRDEDGWVETLALEESVLVQPGWFFDFDRDGFLVVSLLPEPERFAAAAGRLVRRLCAA